jgi:hypothetical protein
LGIIWDRMDDIHFMGYKDDEEKREEGISIGPDDD